MEKKTGSSDANGVAIITEYILVYSKNSNDVTFSKNQNSYDKKRYRYEDKYVSRRGPFYFDTLDRGGLRYSDSLNFGIELPDGKILYPHGRTKFVNDGWTWKWSKEKIKWGLDNGFCEFIKDKNNNWGIKYKVYLNVNNEDKVIDREAPWKNLIEGIMNTHASSEITKIFGSKVFGTPKPEKLMDFIINLASFEGDLVLDFFMGSATTQAVALKMNRHFIGIEQMDYINTVSVPRLQKVIAGEQGGISKAVDWQGGGSFIYAELMEKNQGYLKDLQQATTIPELMSVYQRMLTNADLDFRVDLDKFSKEIDKFTSLSDRRKELIRILDKNQLYYNYNNLNDANVKDLLTPEEYRFNRSFYQQEGKE